MGFETSSLIVARMHVVDHLLSTNTCYVLSIVATVQAKAVIVAILSYQALHVQL